jgi:hypothetical protein
MSRYCFRRCPPVIVPIHDDTGKLVETHEKFPVDKGHQKV